MMSEASIEKLTKRIEKRPEDVWFTVLDSGVGDSDSGRFSVVSIDMSNYPETVVSLNGRYEWQGHMVSNYMYDPSRDEWKVNMSYGPVDHGPNKVDNERQVRALS